MKRILILSMALCTLCGFSIRTGGGNIDCTTLTGSYQALVTAPFNTSNWTFQSTCDKKVYIQIGATGPDLLVLPLNQPTLDLRPVTQDQGDTTDTVSIKHAGEVPTTGDFVAWYAR